MRSFTRRGFVRLAAVPAASVFFAACSQAAPTAAPEPKPAAPTAPAAAPSAAPTQAPVVQATPAAAKPATTGDKKTWSFQSFTGGSQELLWNGYNYTEWRKAFPEYEHNFSWFSYGAYKDKMPAQIASGDIPDVMMVNAVNDIPLLMANNMIIPLNDHLKSQGKELMQRTPPEYFATATYQGQYMYMPATWNPNLWVTHTRVDWLQKLGVKGPMSLADYELVMDAFTNKDPDGNGKKDTYAYEINTALYFDDWMFHAFGVAVGHHHNGFWRKRGSKIESDWVQPGMKDALNWIAGQWKKGVFHPNSLTGDITSRTGWASGITGFIYTSAPGTFSTQTALRAIVKDATVAAIDPPKGPGGQGSSGEGMQWGYCISKKAKNPEDVVRMHNWQFTPEGYNKTCAGDAGVPGLTIKGFTPEGYFIMYSAEEQANMPDWPDRAKKAADQTLYMNIRRQDDDFFKGAPDAMTKYYQQHYAEVMPKEYNATAALAKKYSQLSLKQAPVPSDTKFFPRLMTKFQEVLSQIASGAAPTESAWSEWTQFWDKNGGPQITEEVNKAAG